MLVSYMSTWAPIQESHESRVSWNSFGNSRLALPGSSIPKCIVSDQKWWLFNMFLYVSMSAPGIRRQQWELCHWHRPGIVDSIIDVSMYLQASNFISIVFNRAQINERLILVSLTWPLWFLIMLALDLTSSKHLWEIDRRILPRLPQEILAL